MTTQKKGSAPLSRRRFVTLLAAGSAALIAPGGAIAAATAPAATRRPARPAATASAGLSQADRKELIRQQAAARATVEVIRKHPMPPGTEMASIFKPLRSRRGNG
jgi:hypothetical protein